MVSFILISFTLLLFSCNGNIENKFNTDNFSTTSEYSISITDPIIPAAERLRLYIPNLKNKKVGVVVNQTSIVNSVHLVDTLISLDINIQKIFSPEHGFKGAADAGEKVDDGLYKDIEVISLYGKNRKPSDSQMSDLDVIVFDIQDVGVRFYTYISTMTYVMEAAAKNKVPVMILDRPNPNGFYVDGPTLEDEFKSFVGLHNVPVVYGMTMGEYAQMVNGESWLDTNSKCDLTIIPCNNYDHTMTYDLPVKPSPNLPNLKSILLYPSLCFFEGTTVSIGRGTNKQFQIIGHPSASEKSFSFTPKPGPGAANPKLNGKKCFGDDLSEIDIITLTNTSGLNINYLIEYYNYLNNKNANFFNDNNFFEKLAGTKNIRESIINNVSASEIKNNWKSDLIKFKKIRKKYLLYKDFE